MWAIITLIILQFIGFFISAAEKSGREIFWTIFGLALQWWLLYMAGLFDKYIG